MSQPAAKDAPPTAPEARPAAAGQLAERPFARLLHQLMRKRVTGWLVVTDQTGDESRVFLREGAPVHVVRPNDADRLDQVVAAAGLVSPEVLREVAAQLPPGKRLGEVLVERNLVAEATLADLLKMQMRRKLARLFHIQQGSFAVYVDAHRFGAGSEFREMRVDPRILVLEGIRSAYDEARLRAELAPLGARRFRLLPSVPGSLLEAMGFPARDPTVALLGSPRGLNDFPGAGVPAKEALAVLLALLYADLLEAEVAPAAATPPSPAAPASPGRGASAAAPARADDAALAARIDDLLARAPGLSHFELLGVPDSVTPEALAAAYLGRMREFHPDRIAGRGLRELAGRAAQLVARINEANGVLSDPKRRAAYVASRTQTAPPADLVRALISAEDNFRKGEVHLRKGDYLQAGQAFAAAATDAPQEPIYRAYAAWCACNAPGASKDQLGRDTLAQLQAVAKDRPKFALGQHWQGLLHKHFGELAAAESAFRAAVALDRTLLDAERELRVLEMRKNKAPAATAPAADKPGAISAARKR
jgi:hypothetical protein